MDLSGSTLLPHALLALHFKIFSAPNFAELLTGGGQKHWLPPSKCGRYHQETIDADGAAKIARAWIADRIDPTPADWPSGTYGDFGPPEDYFVFGILPRPLRHLGGSQYIAVHKLTGKAQDLGYVGE